MVSGIPREFVERGRESLEQLCSVLMELFAAGGSGTFHRSIRGDDRLDCDLDHRDV